MTRTYNKIVDNTDNDLAIVPEKHSLVWHIIHFFQENRQLFVHGALLFAQVLWGGMTVWGKGALQQGLSATLFVVLRLGASAAIFHLISMIFYRKEYFKLPSLSDLFKMVKCAICLTLTTGLFTYGLMLSTATNSVILEQTTLIWTALITLAIGREKSSVVKIAGIFFGALGGFIMAEIEKLSFKPSDDSEGANMKLTIGNILLLLQGVAFSLYTISGETLFKHIPAPVAHSWLNTIAALMHLAFSAIVFGNPFGKSSFDLPLTAWLSIAYSVCVGTVFAYQLYSWGLKHASALTASVYFPFQALSGMLLAFLFLGEHFTWRVLAGGALVFVGLALVVYSQKQEETHEKSSKSTNAADYSQLTTLDDTSANITSEDTQKEEKSPDWVELEVRNLDSDVIMTSAEHVAESLEEIAKRFLTCFLCTF